MIKNYFVEKKDGKILRLFETFTETIEGCTKCTEEEFKQYEIQMEEQIKSLNTYTPTPMELREKAYETERVIFWEDKYITIDEANKKWLNYTVEGSEKADEIAELVIITKEEIRVKYPDAV